MGQAGGCPPSHLDAGLHVGGSGDILGVGVEHDQVLARHKAGEVGEVVHCVENEDEESSVFVSFLRCVKQKNRW